MKKSRILCLLILTICAFLVTIGNNFSKEVFADGEHIHDEHTFMAWDNSTQLPNSTGYFYLTTDVTVSDSWNIYSDADVHICLNGHSVTFSGYEIYTIGMAKVSIYDCGTEEHHFSINSETHAAILDENGDITITGGYITSNNPNNPVIRLMGENTEFNMYGGTIIGGGSTGSSYVTGGAVSIYSDCIFNMYGGEICYNAASVGGAVLCDGTFNMYGGEIHHNYSTYMGSAVLVNGNFIMCGGSIHHNDGEDEKVKSAVCIENNPVSSGRFRMNGGSITNNSGSGVLFAENTDFEQTAFYMYDSPVIKDNEINVNLVSSEDYHTKIELRGSLTEAAEIGIYANTEDFLTSSWGMYMNDADPKNYIFMDDPSLSVSVFNGELQAIGIPHDHIWSYSLNDNVITATCSAEDCPSPTATITIQADDKDYDGKPVVAKLVTSKGWTTKNGLEIPEVEYTGNTKAGTYTASITIDGKTISDSFTISPMTFVPWTETNSLPTEPGNYKLMQDVYLSETWRVPGFIDDTTNLNLNGHGIIMTGIDKVILNQATLNIYDDADEVIEHRYSVEIRGNESGLATVDDTLTEKYKIFTGGYITGGQSEMGAGIYNNMNLNIYGGTIIGNKAKGDGNYYVGGGAISNYSGKVTIYDCDIIYNVFDNDNSYSNYTGGGAIFNYGTIESALLIINGGRIAYNYTNNNGGAIGYISSTTIINGGIIEGNYANGIGGAGYGLDSVMIINGGTVENNYANDYGGAFYLSCANNSSGYLEMSGGSLVGNRASLGGAIYIYSSSFIMNGGRIAFNTAFSSDERAAGGVFITDSKGKDVRMTGGSIDHNNAEKSVHSFEIGCGGVVLEEGTVLSLSGSPVIMDNVYAGTIEKKNGVYTLTGGTPNNLSLTAYAGYYDPYVDFSAHVAEGCQIGITIRYSNLGNGSTSESFSDFAYVDYFSGKEPSYYFVSDRGWPVGIDPNSGQLVLMFAEYSVSFDANGGSGDMESILSIPEFTLPACTFTSPSEDLLFAGWIIDGNDKVYKVGEKIYLTEDTVLKASWIKGVNL